MTARLPILALLALLAAARPLAAQAPVATATSTTALTPGECPARLLVQDREQEVYLARIERDMLYFRLPSAPAGTLSAIRLDTVQAAYFPIELEEFNVFEAVRNRRWEEAAVVLLRPFAPALPFLALPQNNAVEPALEAGLYFMRAASAATREQKGLVTPAAAALYERALRVFAHIARAEWFGSREQALLRAAMCHTACERLDQAEKILQEARLPDPGDGDYGLYHLSRASLLFAQGRMLDAANAAALSVAFENKDPRVFPDALLLSARAHEEIMDYYRARDIYFEVARLFGATEWGEIALARLAFIMENQLTAEKEKANIAKVFFGTAEDMDQIVRAFLDTQKDKLKPKPPTTNPDPAAP